MHLGRHTCISELIALSWNLLYHSILTNVFRQTYLYKLIDYTWQETNVSFHAYLCSLVDILVQVIRSHLAITKYNVPFWPMLLARHTCISDLITLGRNLMYHSILTNALRQTNLYKCFFFYTLQELNISFHFGQLS